MSIGSFSVKMSEEANIPEDPLVTREMVIDILKKFEGTKNIQLIQFETGPGTEKGENWSSILIR
jgi:hypothetical protein